MHSSKFARISVRRRRSSSSGTSRFESAPFQTLQSKWCARHPSGTRCVELALKTFATRYKCVQVLLTISRKQPVDAEAWNATHINRCESSNAGVYKGPSPIGSCRFIGDRSCVSEGPDFAAGLVLEGHFNEGSFT